MSLRIAWILLEFVKFIIFEHDVDANIKKCVEYEVCLLQSVHYNSYVM